MSTVEVRCPVGPRKLFTKLKLGEETGGYLSSGLIEFSCRDCAKRLRVNRVFHRFDFLGELIETDVEEFAGLGTALR